MLFKSHLRKLRRPRNTEGGEGVLLPIDSSFAPLQVEIRHAESKKKREKIYDMHPYT